MRPKANEKNDEYIVYRQFTLKTHIYTYIIDLLMHRVLYTQYLYEDETGLACDKIGDMIYALLLCSCRSC